MAATKSPDRTALDNLDPGFYALDQDVKNPKPDRRYNGVLGRPTIPQGFRVQVVRVPVTQDRYRIELRGFGGNTIPDSDDCPLAHALAPHLQPVTPALGHLVTTQYPAEAILATLLEQGKITLDDVRQTHPAIAALDDQDWEAFTKQHWVDRTAW